MFSYIHHFFSISVLSILIGVMGMNGGYFPVICWVYLSIPAFLGLDKIISFGYRKMAFFARLFYPIFPSFITAINTTSSQYLMKT